MKRARERGSGENRTPGAGGPRLSPGKRTLAEKEARASRRRRPGPNTENTETGREPPNAGERGTEYTIERGDTLWGIAAEELGAGDRWPEVYGYDDNERIIGNNPGHIVPGQTIRIPEAERDAGAESEAGAEGGWSAEISNAGAGLCAPPPFQHVTIFASEEMDGRHLDFAEDFLEDLLSEWRAPFDPEWLTLHMFSEDRIGIVLAWQPEWGEITERRDYGGNTNPLRARLAVTAAEASAGWAAIDSDKRPRVRDLLGGETNEVSATARKAFLRYYGDRGWAHQPPEAQAAIFEDLLTSEDARPANLRVYDESQPAAFELDGPQRVADHEFRGATADADIWTCRIGDVEIPIIAPAHPDEDEGHFHDAEEVARAIAMVPEVGRALIESVTLNPVQNPDDEFWAEEYDREGFRSYMTAGAAGEVTIYPSRSARDETSAAASLKHEIGHTWSHQQWGHDTDDERWRPWREAMESDRVSVSNYATADPSEDVAETVQAYTATKGTPEHDEFRRLVPARFAILDEHFGGG